MSLKLVIFDVDGLLLDTERVWQDVWYDTARDFGIDAWKREDFLNVVGRSGQPVYDYMEELFRGRCSTEEFMKVARQHGVERLERELTAKPGAVELLNCIKKAGLPCAVATATSRSLTEERLTRLQLIQYFDYICCGDEVVERKPSPEAYLKVLAKMNTAPEDALVFEDSKVGVQAAWNARIPVIMVPDLMPPTEVQKRQAIKIIASLSEAVPIIEELSKDGTKHERCI